MACSILKNVQSSKPKIQFPHGSSSIDFRFIFSRNMTCMDGCTPYCSFCGAPIFCPVSPWSPRATISCPLACFLLHFLTKPSQCYTLTYTLSLGGNHLPRRRMAHLHHPFTRISLRIIAINRDRNRRTSCPAYSGSKLHSFRDGEKIIAIDVPTFSNLFRPKIYFPCHEACVALAKAFARSGSNPFL